MQTKRKHLILDIVEGKVPSLEISKLLPSDFYVFAYILSDSQHFVLNGKVRC